jgi:hypothetical protein
MAKKKVIAVLGAARKLDVARILYPGLQTFSRWLARNKGRIPTE